MLYLPLCTPEFKDCLVFDEGGQERFFIFFPLRRVSGAWLLSPGGYLDPCCCSLFLGALRIWLSGTHCFVIFFYNESGCAFITPW